MAAVLARDTVDQFHDENGFTDTRTAEEADLTALGEGTEKIDRLDPGLQHFGLSDLIGEARRVTMDGPLLPGLDFRLVIDG